MNQLLPTPYLEYPQKKDSLNPLDSSGQVLSPVKNDAALTTDSFQLSGEKNSTAQTSYPIQMPREEIHPPGWYVYFLLALIVFVAIARKFYGNLLVKNIKAATSYTINLKMLRDSSVVQKQQDYLLYGLYFLVVGFYSYIIELHFDIRFFQLSGISLFLFNTGVLAGLFIARSILLHLVGSLFKQRDLFKAYLYNSFTYNKVLGLILLPLLFLVIYTEGEIENISLWISYATIASIILLRISRAILFAKKEGVLNFYLFLYLCALEIVPILLIYKWLTTGL